MPVPAPNLYPDFNTVRLSHVCLNVADLDASRAFYVDTLGLQITDADDTHIYLRAMEERGHHCIILQKSDQPGTVEVMGFKTFDDEDLDRADAYFQSKGRPTEWVTRPFLFLSRTLLTSDNMGIPLEFYHKMDRLAPIHQEYALYRGVKPLRIDHFNCFSPDVDASVAFYSDFGFRVTEYTEDEDSFLFSFFFFSTAKSCGPLGCSARVACMTWRSPTAPAHACTMSRSGCPRR